MLKALISASVVHREPASVGVPGKTLLVSYQPVRDEGGEILGVSVSIADISAMKEKEAELRESEDHYRHTVELNPQVPWVMDSGATTSPAAGEPSRV